MTLVDTVVWSLALRRRGNGKGGSVGTLFELIDTNQVVIIGPIRQELLSGIRRPEDFERLRTYLAAFPDTPLDTSDYVEAARFSNICRKAGIQGSPTDFLICAVAVRLETTILTEDKNFSRFAKLIPIGLLVEN